MSLDELGLLQQPRATTPADEYHWYLLYQLIRGLEWLKLKVQQQSGGDDDDDNNNEEVRMQQQQQLLTSEASLESLKGLLENELEEINTDNLLYAENLKQEDRANQFPQDEEVYPHDLRLGKFRQQEGYEERLERFRREWTEEAALERIAELFGVWSDVRKRLGLTTEKDMVAVREHMRKTVVDRQEAAARFKPTYSLYPRVSEDSEVKVMKRSPK